MIRGGFKRKRGLDGQVTFAYYYSNRDLENIIKTPPQRDFICVSYLKYIAHICRHTSLAKKSLFSNAKCRYFRDPWIKISKLLGDISITQSKKETQSRVGFTRLLIQNYPFLSHS